MSAPSTKKAPVASTFRAAAFIASGDEEVKSMYTFPGPRKGANSSAAATAASGGTTERR